MSMMPPPPPPSPTMPPRQPTPDLAEQAGLRAMQAQAQIASQLFLSGHTVRNYVSSIFSKLQVADRAEAIVRAREAGL